MELRGATLVQAASRRLSARRGSWLPVVVASRFHGFLCSRLLGFSKSSRVLGCQVAQSDIAVTLRIRFIHCKIAAILSARFQYHHIPKTESAAASECGVAASRLSLRAAPPRSHASCWRKRSSIARQKYHRQVVGFAASLQTVQAPSDVRREARCPQPRCGHRVGVGRIDEQNVPRTTRSFIARFWLRWRQKTARPIVFMNVALGFQVVKRFLRASPEASGWASHRLTLRRSGDCSVGANAEARCRTPWAGGSSPTGRSATPFGDALCQQRASSLVRMDSVSVEMARMVDDFVKRCRMSFAGA